METKAWEGVPHCFRLAKTGEFAGGRSKGAEDLLTLPQKGLPGAKEGLVAAGGVSLFVTTQLMGNGKRESPAMERTGAEKKKPRETTLLKMVDGNQEGMK